MTESVIDFPKDRLCSDVWELGFDETGTNEVWRLKKDVVLTISLLALLICPEAKTIHITGSITSNQYTENADIDVHFLDIGKTFETVEEVEEYNKLLRAKYPVKSFILKHPIEIYYQNNQFQDFMSVGCYDFFKKLWIVGPDFKDPSFNPYSEYYAKLIKNSEKIAKLIRNMIFSIYEIAIVLKKNIGEDTELNIAEILKSRLSAVKSLYDSIRNSRKVYSSPKSFEQALQYRNSEKWHIADATFKLFDKYGYLAILQQFSKIYDLLLSSDDLNAEISDAILKVVKENIANADKLSENEMYETDKLLDEGLLKMISIAGLLAISNVLPEHILAKELAKVPTDQLHMSTNAVLNAIDKSTVDNKMIGKFSYRNTINILQWVYYTEAANLNFECRKATFSIVWNRAGGKAKNLIPVVLKHTVNKDGKTVYQFSEWKSGNNWGLIAPKTNSDWKYRVPKDITNPNVKKIWKESENFAKLLIDEKWKSNIGKCNLISSKNDSEDAKKTWGKLCSAQIGDHYFGYDPYLDGFKHAKAVYTIIKGDTGYKIASKLNITFSKLLAKNPNVNWNKLQIGLKLKI